MQISMVNAKTAPQPGSGYSQVVEASGGKTLLFMSGQLGMAIDGTIPATIAEQLRLVWANVGAQLQAAHMSWLNVVKVTMIVVDRADIAACLAARNQYLSGYKPASTVLVAGLADPVCKVEIEVTAYS